MSKATTPDPASGRLRVMTVIFLGVLFAGLSMAGTMPWWAPVQQRRLAHHAMRSAHRALAPVSRRVRANVRRLRRR